MVTKTGYLNTAFTIGHQIFLRFVIVIFKHAETHLINVNSGSPYTLTLSRTRSLAIKQDDARFISKLQDISEKACSSAGFTNNFWWKDPGRHMEADNK